MNNSIVVNADDFGWNKTCSSAILESFDKGYITTTTACVNGAFFSEAVSLIKETPYRNRVGIHINLTEGKPVSEGIMTNKLFCNDNGEFTFFSKRLKILSSEDKKNVYDEITAQVQKYKATGLSIHHADSHHHIHNAPNIYHIFMKVMEEQGIRRIRKFRNIGSINCAKRLAKKYYNMQLDQSRLSFTDYFGEISDLESFDESKLYRKTLEIMIHPDYDASNILIDRDESADYSCPFGESLSAIYNKLEARSFTVLRDY